MAENNATILDAIWLNGSNDYQQRIPQSTQNGVDAIFDALYEPQNRNFYNEFETALFNRIGQTIVRGHDWKNPLAKFKTSMLPMGGAIQEIAMDYIEASGYNIKDSNVFKQNKNEVYQAIHHVNREDRYDITIARDELRKAFVSEFGLNEFLSRKLAIPGNSSEYDEYRIMVQLIAIAYSNNAIYKVNTPIANVDAPTADELKVLSTQIRTAVKKLSLVPTGRYNSKGVPAVSRPEDLVILTTPAISAAMDVNVLADAFNQSKADFNRSVIEIDEFPMDGVYAMVVDKSWFIAADYVREIASFWNAKNLTTNFYLHHWGVYSVSPFANAVIFGEASGSIPGVISVQLDSISASVVDEAGDSASAFSYGDALELKVTGAATISPVNSVIVSPDAYSVEISITDGAAEDPAVIPIKSKTYVDRNGLIHLQAGLPAGAEVTFAVTSTYVDPSSNGAAPVAPKTSTAVITVA